MELNSVLLSSRDLFAMVVVSGLAYCLLPYFAAAASASAEILRGLPEAFAEPPAATGVGPFPDDPNPLQLRLFTDAAVQSFGARCLDGSPSGYYYREGTTDKDSFVIYLQGGGLCINEESCQSRAKGRLGSSKAWSSNHTDHSNVLSSNATYNPFATWSHVFVPYGSGDIYVGTQREKNNMGLYFAGHLTVEAVVSDLINTTTFGSAKMVLLSGGSAGGIGVFQNADWLGSKLSASTTYRASPQAGAYFVNEDVRLMVQYETKLLNVSFDTAAFMADYLVSFFGGLGKTPPFLDQSCMAAKPLGKKHLCWSAAVHYPYITTPLFVAQNRFDQNQASAVFGVGGSNLTAAAKADFVRYFGRQTLAGIHQLVVDSPKSDGIFMPSCYMHTQNLCMLGSSLVRNVSYAQALASWFVGDKSVPHQLLDDCNDHTGKDDPCNDFCSCAYRT